MLKGLGRYIGSLLSLIQLLLSGGEADLACHYTRKSASFWSRGGVSARLVIDSELNKPPEDLPSRWRRAAESSTFPPALLDLRRYWSSQVPARSAENIQNVTVALFATSRYVRLFWRLHTSEFIGGRNSSFFFTFTGATHFLFSEIVTATDRRNVSRRPDDSAACHSIKLLWWQALKRLILTCLAVFHYFMCLSAKHWITGTWSKHILLFSFS